MATTLTGYPSEAKSGALEPLDLGEVIIAADPADLRALANHLLNAARALEQGALDGGAFTFADAKAPRNTPSQVFVVPKGARK